LHRHRSQAPGGHTSTSSRRMNDTPRFC
jgi:hypothetical protein